MDMLKSMKESLMCAAQTQMSHLDSVDAKELGEVIDMIKDLEEAIYYCTITEAMHQKTNESQPMDYNRMYYDGGMSYRMYTDGGRAYAGNNGSNASNRVHSNGRYGDGSDYESRDRQAQRRDEMMDRDPREGSSPELRRMYMESKQMHHGKTKQLQELEKYMKELSNDLVEMIEDASPEEKQYLGNRLSALATKIAKLEQ